MPAIKIREFKPLERNSLRGFATVEFPSGTIVSDIAIHVSHGKPWASPPSKPMLDRNGVALRDENGKIKYQPIASFNSKETRDRWSAAVIEAVRLAHPEALA